MAAAIPPSAIMTVIQFPKSADGAREPTDFLHRIQKHLMLFGHVVRKVITDDVLMLAGVALQHGRFPGVSERIVYSSRLPHQEGACWTVPRRRQTTRASLQQISSEQ